MVIPMIVRLFLNLAWTQALHFYCSAHFRNFPKGFPQVDRKEEENCTPSPSKVSAKSKALDVQHLRTYKRNIP
jgi:hypothetical protein